MLYTLCEQQLSKQPHYDFGLRNILSVLRTAGADEARQPQPTTEMLLMMQTLRDMNVTKFVAQDVPTFSALMRDLFPRVDEAPPSASEFGALSRRSCRGSRMDLPCSWADKCLQLYESYHRPPRHHARRPLGQRQVDRHRVPWRGRSPRWAPSTSVSKMNPKAITAPQMFGRLDASTGDWTDGIFASCGSKAARTSHAIWIVVDGPVDAVWIENLNTVLDDNKVLTLANGDRIPMMPHDAGSSSRPRTSTTPPPRPSPGRESSIMSSERPSAGGPLLRIVRAKATGSPAVRANGLSELVEACLGALASVAAAPSTAGAAIRPARSARSPSRSARCSDDGGLSSPTSTACWRGTPTSLTSLSQGGHAGSHAASHVAKPRGRRTCRP